MIRYGILAAAFLFALASSASAKDIPIIGMVSGMGVNIHFTGDQAMELDMIQEGGFRVVRMDLSWSSVEKVKGKYDFSGYDALTRGLMSRGIRPLYILDYGNPLYNDGKGTMNTVRERDAFAKFARTVVNRYKGKGIIYELWNEPNHGGFWKNPNPADYMRLAEQVLPALRSVDPSAALVAPGTSGVDLSFLEGCFSRGLLNLIDGVSVHPYRQNNPETAETDILALRALIARYSPDKPNIPIISSEWGYSTGWSGLSEERQGEYLPRQQLHNLSIGIPISIWYDWHDDGLDPDEPEHHFGSVDYWYGSKPAYEGAKELYSALNGYKFIKRLAAESPNDYLLLFSNGDKLMAAVWTTAPKHDIELYKGKMLSLTSRPQYIPIPSDAAKITADSSWTVAPRTYAIGGGSKYSGKLYPAFTISLKNPFFKEIDTDIEVVLPEGVTSGFNENPKIKLAPGESREIHWVGKLNRRDYDTVRIKVKVSMGDYTSWQPLALKVVDPISVTLAPLRDGKLAIIAGGLSDELDKVMFTEPVKFSPRADTSLFPSELLSDLILIPMPSEYRISSESTRITLVDGSGVCIYSSESKILPLNTAKSRVNAVNDGDLKIKPKYSLSEVTHGGDGVPLDVGLVLSYEFKEGWNFIQIKPKSAIRIEGEPKAIGVWVKGNNSRIPLRMRFVDKNNRTFQPDFPALDFTGWRFLTAPLNNPNVGTWGGKADETAIKYPIRIDSLFLLDGSNTTLKGEIEFADCVLLY